MSYRVNRSGSYRRQRGVVLIMALFIVMLVTVVVVSVSWRFTLSMARNENRWHGAQAHAYLGGGEQAARLILFGDANMGGESVDHLGEDWAQDMGALPTDEGWIRGRLEDAHGRINLNLLLPPPPVSAAGAGASGANSRAPTVPGAQYSAMQRLFIRFLQTIELEEGPVELDKAIQITEAIQDWLDADNTPTGFSGAERSVYEGRDPPYPIANGPMTTVSELQVIEGMTSELFNKLQPFVIALPVEAKPNINTLKPELFRGFNRKDLLEPLDPADQEALLQERTALLPVKDENGLVQEGSGPGGYTKVEEFKTDPEVINILGEDGVADLDMVVQSNYFLLEGETLVGEQVRRRKSILFREGANSVEVVRRTDAGY